MLTIYLDKSNIIKLQLQSGKGAANLALVSKIVVKIDEVEIDSSHEDNLVHEYITWGETAPTFNEPNLFLKLGKHPSLQGYEGFREMRITVFDDANVNGLVWIDSQPIKLITELDQEPQYTDNTGGNITFELINNTTLTLKVKGSDGVIRSATLTLS